MNWCIQIAQPSGARGSHEMAFKEAVLTI